MRSRRRSLLWTLAAVAVWQTPLLLPARAQNVDVGSVIGGLIEGAVRAENARRAVEGNRRSRLPLTRTASDPTRDSRAYTIDGRTLGETLQSGDLPFDFNCRASEQFPGARWCRSRKGVQSVMTATSILLKADGSIAYYNKFFEAANYEPNAIPSEIRRLSSLFHEQPRVLRMPRQGDDDGVIALWGSMDLTPLDSATITQLAAGQSVTTGIMVDFLGNVRDSARSGLPVYRIAGGPGYYWAARFDARGQGNLRFGMANALSYEANVPPAVPDIANAGPAEPPSAPDVSKQAEAAALAQAVAQQAAAEQVRLNEQKEQERKLEAAEEQAARDAAAAKLKTERLARASTAAKLKLSDAASFVQVNRDDPQLMEHLQKITDLNTVLSGTEPEVIEQKTALLAAGLTADAAYSAYAAKREAEFNREHMRDMQDAVHDLQIQKKVLIEAVAQDPMSAAAADLLTLAKKVDSAIAAEDLERLQTLIGNIDASLDKAGLSKTLLIAKQDDAKAKSDASSK